VFFFHQILIKTGTSKKILKKIPNMKSQKKKKKVW